MKRKWLVMAMVPILAVSSVVMALDHWAQVYVGAGQPANRAAVLEQPITEREFYQLLGRHTGVRITGSSQRSISRETACLEFARFLPESSVPYSFTDAAQVAPASKAALENLHALGMIVGYPDGSFKPRKSLTLGEAYRLFHMYDRLAAADPPASVVTATRTVDAAATGGRRAPAPRLRFEARMGGSFREIDVTVTEVANLDSPQVFFAVQESGSPPPSEADLRAGTAQALVTGRCADLISGVPFRFSLTGANGLIDGYNYDVYMVATDGGGKAAEMQCVTAMAMPFAARGTEADTFVIKPLDAAEIKRSYPDLFETARQLDNIQRLAALYTESGGVHGSERFLSGGYTYVLAGDMDLSGYMSHARETGWSPIGATIPFRGCFDGGGHTIKGLYIDHDAGVLGDAPPVAGLFGRVGGAVIRNVVLDAPVVMIHNVSGVETYAGYGALVGESSQSVIEHITINAPTVNAASAEDGMCAVGSVVGSALDTDLRFITVTGAEIISAGSGIRDISGGIAGRYYVSRGGPYQLRDLSAAGVLHAGGKAAGGIVGTLDIVGGARTDVSVENINALMRVSGGAAFAGGVAANIGYEGLLPENARLAFDNCYASGMIQASEALGGLFGKVNATAKTGFAVKNSASENDLVPVADSVVIGGFAGEVYSGSFENCHTVGSGITSSVGDAGGFVGIVRGRADFVRCLTNRNVQSAHSAGGFIGSQGGGALKFYNCSTGGRVTGENVAGDFAGSLVYDKFAVEIVNCTVRGAGDSGKLVGNWQ